jgi:hypothetical protein
MVTFNLFQSNFVEDTDTVSPYVYVVLIIVSFFLSIATFIAIVLLFRFKIQYVIDNKESRSTVTVNELVNQ